MSELHEQEAIALLERIARALEDIAAHLAPAVDSNGVEVPIATAINGIGDIIVDQKLGRQ